VKPIQYGAAFIYGQHGEGLRTIAIALGHPQPATPILCDNGFAIGLATDTIKVRKFIEMRCHAATEFASDTSPSRILQAS
jgi:hypothetical protein